MIVLIAHARIERFENPETESYDRYVPRLHRLASQVVQEWCDEVLFATLQGLHQADGRGLRPQAHPGHRHRRADHPHVEAPGPRGEEPPEPPRGDCPSTGTPTPST